MFWWFERAGEYLRCEAVPMSAGGFELRLVHPDGTESVERFSDSSDLAARQDQVITDVVHAGWNGPHGWNL